MYRNITKNPLRTFIGLNSEKNKNIKASPKKRSSYKKISVRVVHLGTCSIAGWNLHGHHRLASARCSRGKDDPVGRSCSSCHRRRRQIGFLRCEARCNRATNGLADHNCSSCHHRRLHGHRPPWGSRGQCVPPFSGETNMLLILTNRS